MVFLPWHLASAYILDLAAGDPQWMPHPVRWIGRAVTWAEGHLYDPAAPPILLRISGAVLWLLVMTITVSSTIVLIEASRLAGTIATDVVLIWLAYTTLATRALYAESAGIAQALRDNYIGLARERLSRIVSRDTSNLEEAEILRALIETVSENISDGIVAPLFYLAIFGPVGALAYKAVNTMDSMLGYMNDRYRYFGWFSARADDAANLIPARISGLLVVGAAACAGGDWRTTMKIMRRDACKMKSPNSGYPEAAAAGALGIELGGTNIYFGQPVEKPRLGDPTEPITLETYRKMIILMYLTSALAFFMAFCIRFSREILERFF